MSGTRRNASSGGPGRRNGRSDATKAERAKADGSRAGDRDRKRFDVRTLLKRLLIAGIVFVLLCVAIFFLAYQRTTIPDPNSAYQAQSTYIYYSNGKAKIGDFAIQNRDSVPLADISKDMQHAIVAAEDRTFWTNKGIDPKGIIRAAFSNASGNSTQGASTITQQYVKLLYLNQQRTFKRKIKEIFLALKIQQQQSKEQILEGYLNTVYFGHGAYGVQAAARTYFGLDAKQLDARQSAMLASIVNSPNNLDPNGDKAERQALLGRYDYVLNGMVKLGTLDAAKEAAWSDKLPKVLHSAPQDSYGGQRGFMLTMVKDELRRIGFSDEQIDGGGLRVTTTFNRKVMSADKSAVEKVAPKGLKKLHVGVASVDVKSGAVLGFFGGQDYLKSQLNYATLPAASVGSSFKPFALAAGLKQGFSLKDTFDGNSPYVFPSGQTVHNEGEASGIADGADYGAHVNLIKGLEESINTVFIDLTVSMKDGPAAIRKTAIDMGLPDNKQIQPTSGIALGSASESPLNMANAYSTIANGGMEHDTFVIKKVTDPTGKTLWEHHGDQHRALSSDIAADVSYAMQQVVQHGTGSAYAPGLGRPAAGKTGTATNGDGKVDSSWWVGFTPEVSTAVMYARGTGHESLEGFLVPYYGANYPTHTWTEAMKAIVAGTPVQQFPPPAFVDGTPPSSGHAPYVPPPTTSAPKPKPQPSKAPKPTPTRTAAPQPTAPATSSAPPPTSPTCVQSAVQDCGTSSSAPPSPTPTPSPTPQAGRTKGPGGPSGGPTP
ncbi:MAG: transglycosylase domain-containing protein [Marmoricola sp.]